MYLLDTNAISETRKLTSSNVNPEFKVWIDGVDPADLYLSVITLMELETGILRLQRRDPQQGMLIRHWFETQVRPNFEGRILNITPEIASTCARLNVPDPRPCQDSWIAATALVHQLIVVTRNVRDFLPMNVKVICPFS